MTERSWWSQHVRPRLFSKDEPRTAIKVQNTSNPGLFDSICCFNGVVLALETKFLQRWPAHATTTVRGIDLTIEQVRHLAEWRRAGGNSCVLLGVQATKEWFLYTASQYQLCQQRENFQTTSIFSGNGWPSMGQIPAFVLGHFQPPMVL